MARSADKSASADNKKVDADYDPAAAVASETPWYGRISLVSLFAGIIPLILMPIGMLAIPKLEIDKNQSASFAEALQMTAAGDQSFKGLEAKQMALQGDNWLAFMGINLLQTISMICAGVVIWFLLRALSKRRPMFAWMPGSALIAMAVLSFYTLALQYSKFSNAKDFADLPADSQTNVAAAAAIDKTLELAPWAQMLVLLSLLLTIVALGVGSVMARNAGLLRTGHSWIGVMAALVMMVSMGQVVGGLLGFITLAFPVFFIMFSIMFWSSRREQLPEAWATGKSVPWPTAVELAAAKSSS